MANGFGEAFRGIAKGTLIGAGPAFAESLPFSTFFGKHNAAATFFDEQGALTSW